MRRTALALIIAGVAASGLAYGQTSDGLNKAQQNLLTSQPDKKNAPDATATGQSSMDTVIENTGMGSEAGSPASMTSDAKTGEVKTNVKPGTTTEMGSGAGENPDPVSGS